MEDAVDRRMAVPAGKERWADAKVDLSESDGEADESDSAGEESTIAEMRGSSSSAAAASTHLPPPRKKKVTSTASAAAAAAASDEDDGNLSGKETNYTSVKSFSSRKSSAQRSSGVKRKKLEKLKAYALAQGKPGVDKEEHTKPHVIVNGQEISDPKTAVETQNKVKLLTDNSTREDMMHRFVVDVGSLFSSWFEPKAQYDEYMRSERQWTETREGWEYCLVCKKWSTPEHKSNNREHIAKINELGATDRMIGSADSTRRFSTSPGLQGFLAKDPFRRHWGSRVDTAMIRLTWQRLHDGAKLEVDMGHAWNAGVNAKKSNYKLTIGGEDILSIGFAAVTYGGDGKYRNGGPDADVAIFWSEAPETLDFGAFDTLIPDGARKMEDFTRPPQGRGRWPVTTIWWKTQAGDHGYMDEREYRSRVMRGLLCAYALCWYQLTDGTWILTVWPIYFRSRL